MNVDCWRIACVCVQLSHITLIPDDGDMVSPKNVENFLSS
jgi:hypothetical protein